MLRGKALTKALSKVQLVTLVGPWHRAVDHDLLTRPPPGFPARGRPQPLWPGGAKLNGGRFTPKGSFNTLYLCSDQTTALLEANTAFCPPNGPIVSASHNPLTLSQVNGILSGVLDLTEGAIQKALDVDEQLLTGRWRTARNPSTHLLARAAQQSGKILALRSFSSKSADGGTIVAVFTDRLAHFPSSFLEVIDSTGRLGQRLP